MPTLESQILEVADRLSSIQKQPLVAFETLPDPGLPDHRIPLATNPELVFSEQLDGSANFGVRWTSPPDPNIQGFELWVQHPEGAHTEAPYVAAVASRSPAFVNIATSESTVGIISIVTVMKSGLKSNILQSPTLTVALEVTDVALDRFAWVNPTSGDGYNVLPIHTFTSGNGSTVTVVNHSGAGRFISFGVALYDVGATSGACDLWVDITIDGGTKQSYQVIFAARVFGETVLPWHVSTGSAPHGDVEGDGILVPVNITYETSLLVEFRVAVTSNFGGGDYDAVCVVHRATLN